MINHKFILLFNKPTLILYLYEFYMIGRTQFFVPETYRDVNPLYMALQCIPHQGETFETTKDACPRRGSNEWRARWLSGLMR